MPELRGGLVRACEINSELQMSSLGTLFLLYFSPTLTFRLPCQIHMQQSPPTSLITSFHIVHIFAARTASDGEGANPSLTSTIPHGMTDTLLWIDSFYISHLCFSLYSTSFIGATFMFGACFTATMTTLKNPLKCQPPIDK